MAYGDLELSVSNSQPIEHLEIRYGNAPGWFYTTSETPVDFNGNTFYPSQIKHAPIVPVADATLASLMISIPQNSSVGQLYRVQPPSGLVFVTLFGAHHLDGSTTVLWKGRVTNFEWALPWINLTVENVFSSLQRPGLRRRISPQCQQVLYKCGVDRELYRTDGVVSAVFGKVIIVPELMGFANDYFPGGFVEWDNPSLMTVERRGIVDFTGADGGVQLSGLPVALDIGTPVSTFPGCDHSIETCIAKFGNGDNCWSMKFVPKKNPFGGAMLY